MLEQLAQYVAGEVMKDPETALAGLNHLEEALFSHHHTAADVAQDALNAWEVGELSDQAAMQVVAVIINDRKRNRPTQRTVTVPASPLDKFRTPEQQRRAAQVHVEAARYYQHFK